MLFAYNCRIEFTTVPPQGCFVSGSHGKVVLVTGGSRGIGRSIVERFLQQGATVITCGRGDRPRHLAAEVVWVNADVSRPDRVAELRRATVTAGGRIDVLVNNAGMQLQKTLPETSDTDWDLVMGTNAKGVFLCCREIIPVMRAAGGGVTINVGSISGFHADRALALYNTSKAFVHGLTRSIAVDHGNEGIRCNAVCPGWIMTEMADSVFDAADDPQAARREAIRRHPVGRLGKPSDVAAAVAWLASEEAAFVSGQTFIVDGGLVAASPI